MQGAGCGVRSAAWLAGTINPHNQTNRLILKDRNIYRLVQRVWVERAYMIDICQLFDFRGRFSGIKGGFQGCNVTGSRDPCPTSRLVIV